MMEQVEFGEVLQDIIQLYRWQYLKQEVKPRPFLYEMAYFLAQSSLLQRPEISNAKSNTKQYREMIEMCTWLLAMDDCPAMETIQLQVNMEAVMRSELNFLSKDERQWRKTVGNMIDDILKIKVVDKRETNKVVDELHSRLLQLVIETSKQIAENPSPCLYQGAEIYAALNSVFPRTSSPYWMDLSDSEKVSQLQELSNIVPGIRMYNRSNSFLGAMNLQEEKGSKVNFIKGDEAQLVLMKGVGLQLGGYCAVAIAKNRGLLLQGDPTFGLVEIGGNHFSFSSADALHEFMEAPFSFLAKVEIVARMLPHLVNILRLHGEPRFSQLAISNIIDAVDRQPILCEFSTQTATHILPPHQWDEETLFKRALQLASKQTHSAQTNLSCFRRDSYAQVWRLKEKDTQSPFCGSTTMPKRVKYFENLRGPPNCKFNVVDITLEV